MIPPNLFIAVCSVLTLIGAVWIYKLHHRFLGNAIKHLPGPPSHSWLYGNLHEYLQAEAGVKDIEWQSTYGGALRLRGPLHQNYLFLLDPRALQYVTQTAGYRFPKHRERKALMYMIGGSGLVWADGNHHKLQRRVMLPGFGGPEARALLPIFMTGIAKMVSKWRDIISESSDQSTVLDAHWYVSRATLDIIGEAAFEYDFGAQDNSNNALAIAFKNLFFDTMGKVTKNSILFSSLLQFIPERIIYWLFDSYLIGKLKHAKEAADLSESVSRQLLKEKSDALLQGEGSHDIMSLIVKSNAAEDIKSKMSEVDVIAQLRTIMLAGHETTTNAVSWILLELSRRPHIQERLRKEIREMEKKKKHHDDPWTWQELESMPYLTAIVKEGLRYHSVIYVMERQAAEDDVIPLSTPIVTQNGQTLNEIPVQKGQKIMLSVAGYNRNKDIFGEDADVFNPDRWFNREGKTYAGGVGVYGNLLTFSGGTRSCIGWRFAVLELHALTVEVISNFELSLSPGAGEIRREAMGVMAPVVDGEVEKGTQLPLMIRMASRNDD